MEGERQQIGRIAAAITIAATWLGQVTILFAVFVLQLIPENNRLLVGLTAILVWTIACLGGYLAYHRRAQRLAR